MNTRPLRIYATGVALIACHATFAAEVATTTRRIATPAERDVSSRLILMVPCDCRCFPAIAMSASLSLGEPPYDSISEEAPQDEEVTRRTSHTVLGDIEEVMRTVLEDIRAFHREKEFRDAASASFDLLRISPDASELVLNRLLIYAVGNYKRDGLREELLRQLDLCLEEGVTLGGQLLLVKWQTLRELNQYDESIEVLREMVDLYPDSEELAEMYYDVALDLAKAHRYEQTRVVLKKIIAGFPQTDAGLQANVLLARFTSDQEEEP